MSDLQFALRQLLKNPGFTAVAVLTLALGIGANTAIFSVADAVLWKMLPVVDPEQLVLLDRYAANETPPSRKFCEISYPLMKELERRSPQLTGATTFKGGEMLAGVSGEVVPVKTLGVAENFYSLLGLGAIAGRTIQPGDIGGDKVVVLSHAYWRSQFGGQPAIGTSMILDGTSHTIIGVMAREFFGLNPGDTFDVSIPLAEADLQMGALPTDPNVQPLFWVVARLKPNVSRTDAAQSLTTLLRQLVREENPAGLAPEAISQQRIQARPASQGLNALRAKFSQPLVAGRAMSWSGRFLVTGQTALSVVLLVAAGLFVRTLQYLRDFDAGFQRENLLLVALDPQRAGLSGPALADFYAGLLARFEASPGVVSATFERNIPLSGAGTQRPIAPPGYLPPGGESAIATPTEEVGPAYFETIGMGLNAGRDFRASDDRNAPKVVVINEAAVKEFFPGERAPLGRRMGQPPNRTEFEVIGIARDARHANLREPALPMIYLPALQDPKIRDTRLMIRTEGDPLAFAQNARQIVRSANPNVPIMGVTTFEETASRALLQERLIARLATIFGVLAMAQSAAGLGGVLLYAVARRTREIGIRMALGATRRTVTGMVLGESLRLVGAGLMVGLPCAILAARAAEGLLFGVTPTDPATLLVITTSLIGAALLAACWPARRAAKIHPMVALRSE